MTSINCPIARNLMPLHLDGNLRPEDAAALRFHLEACRDCSDEFAVHRKAYESVKAASKEIDAMAWPDISGKVMEKVRREASGSAVIVPARPRMSSFAMRAAACLIFGVAIGFAFFGYAVPGDSVIPDAEAAPAGLRALGVDVKPINETLRRAFNNRNGMMVTNVAKNSPAAMAGIEPWDLIVEVDDCPMQEMRQLHEFFKKHEFLMKDEITVVLIGKKGDRKVIKVRKGN